MIFILGNQGKYPYHCDSIYFSFILKLADETKLDPGTLFSPVIIS
jgi:hypothetical protein